jgi:hypothetical protein
VSISTACGGVGMELTRSANSSSPRLFVWVGIPVTLCRAAWFIQSTAVHAVTRSPKRPAAGLITSRVPTNL